MGYQNELSYHQVLYPNEGDTRKLLMWLQDMLPKQDERASKNDRYSLINKAIDKELNFLLETKSIWTPVFCKSGSLRNNLNFTLLNTRDLYAPSTPVYYRGFARKTPELEKYLTNYLSFITKQTDRQDIVPSIFEYNLQSWTDQQEKENEWNTLGLESGLNPMKFLEKKKKDIRLRMSTYIQDTLNNKIKNEHFKKDRKEFNLDSKFGREIKLRQTDMNPSILQSEEELEQKRVQERDEALQQLKILEDQIKTMENHIEQFINEIRQLKSQLQSEQEKQNVLSRKYEQLKIVFDRLPDAKNNIQKLKVLAEDQSKRLCEFASEWEAHRIPLVDEYRSIRDKMYDKESAAKKKLEQVREIRTKIKSLIEEINKKDEIYKQILEVYKTLPKENRNNYTKRIFEMVKNVKKQIIEINKILVDSKSLQKEINMTTETLNRSFAVTEETVFSDTKKIPESATIYKKLVAINNSFNSSIDTSEKMGSTRNNILNLSEKITKIQTRTSTLNLQTMISDLASVKSENIRFQERVNRLYSKLNQLENDGDVPNENKKREENIQKNDEPKNNSTSLTLEESPL